MLSCLGYLSHLTSFLHLWSYTLAFLLLLWWLNCSYSSLVHLTRLFAGCHFFSHLINDRAQLVVLFHIKISLSTVLLPSTYIPTVKFLPQREENPSLVSLYSSNYGLLSLFLVRTEFVETIVLTALPRLSFFILSSCHYVRTLTHTPLKLLLSRSWWPPFVHAIAIIWTLM